MGVGRVGLVGSALATGALACALHNPAFDESEGASATATAATTATTASGEAMTTTTTGGEATGGEATTATTTTTSGEATTSSGGETTTGGALDCWSAPGPWIVSELATAGLGVDPRSFRYDPDGLGLTYVAGVSGNRMPHRATRAALAEPFGDPVQIAAWEGYGGTVDEAVRVGDELFVSKGVEKVNGADLVVSQWDGATWPLPQAIGAAVNVGGANDRTASLSADGALLVFERNGGPMNAYFGAAALRLYAATRPPGGDPLLDFSAPVELALPPITEDPDAPLITCPTLSADGLHLLFGSTYPTALTPDTIVGAVELYEVARVAVDAPWSPLTHHAELHFDGLHSCPRTITADGCELVFEAFYYTLEDPPMPELGGHFVARRGP
ncbi:MAG: hypothetical protein R3A79_05310 [Nannocystaceae bacterium]